MAALIGTSSSDDNFLSEFNIIVPPLGVFWPLNMMGFPVLVVTAAFSMIMPLVIDWLLLLTETGFWSVIDELLVWITGLDLFADEVVVTFGLDCESENKVK